MRDRDFNITDASRGAAFTVKLVPKATRTEIVGIEEDGTIKIRVIAPPVEDEANEELINFLAQFLSVPTKDIEILGGLNSRKKLITVMNIRAEEVEERVRSVASEIGSDDEDD